MMVVDFGPLLSNVLCLHHVRIPRSGPMDHLDRIPRGGLVPLQVKRVLGQGNNSTHSLQGGLISGWVPINSSALVVFTWICLTKLRLYRFSTRKSLTLACICPPWPGPVHQTSQWRKCNRAGKQALEANCSQHTRTVSSHACAAGGDPWSQQIHWPHSSSTSASAGNVTTSCVHFGTKRVAFFTSMVTSRDVTKLVSSNGSVVLKRSPRSFCRSI